MNNLIHDKGESQCRKVRERYCHAGNLPISSDDNSSAIAYQLRRCTAGHTRGSIPALPSYRSALPAAASKLRSTTYAVSDFNRAWSSASRQTSFHTASVLHIAPPTPTTAPTVHASIPASYANLSTVCILALCPFTKTAGRLFSAVVLSDTVHPSRSIAHSDPSSGRVKR